MEKVLVYGSGGRDHCLCDKYIESRHVEKVYFAPGNPGVKYTNKGRRGYIEQVPIRDFKAVREFCLENQVSLVDVGSENPLDEGLVDVLNKAGLATVGPRAKYVQMENDRVFTKTLLAAAGVPMAEYRAFHDAETAKRYVRNIGYQVVVKANGLAAGKGAIVCDDVTEAEAAIDTLMVKKKFGKSGDTCVIEERKYGNEISFFAYLDGEHFLPLRMFARDYKPACDPGDKETIKLLGGNLNTGGTGCCCPHDLATPGLSNRIIREIVSPTVNAVYNKLGWNYKGVLYFGLNIDEHGDLCVFEINVRHGDPEAQVILRKLQTDLYEIAMATWEGTLDEVKQKWNKNCYVDVIAMAGKARSPSGGWFKAYPGRYGEGYKIEGLENIERGIAIFYSGVDEHPERGLVTKGGRVLHVVGSSPVFEEAVDKAYRNIERLAFLDHRNNNENCLRYRKTIGGVQ